jgi:hypothetical protein
MPFVGIYQMLHQSNSHGSAESHVSKRLDSLSSDAGEGRNRCLARWKTKLRNCFALSATVFVEVRVCCDFTANSETQNGGLCAMRKVQLFYGLWIQLATRQKRVSVLRGRLCSFVIVLSLQLLLKLFTRNVIELPEESSYRKAYL